MGSQPFRLLPRCVPHELRSRSASRRPKVVLVAHGHRSLAAQGAGEVEAVGDVGLGRRKAWGCKAEAHRKTGPQ